MHPLRIPSRYTPLPLRCALWGIEMNYPGSDNSYLLEIANEYASEAFEAAKAKLASLCECEHSA